MKEKVKTNKNYSKHNDKKNGKQYSTSSKHIKKEFKEEADEFVGKTIHVKCKELDEAGKGVCFYQGKKLHIPGILPNEEGYVRILKENRRIVYHIMELEKKSPMRCSVKCKVFEKCGGCQYQHISYYHQLQLKNAYIKDKFKDIRGKYPIYDIIGMDDFDHYRCKNQNVYGVDAQGHIIAGFYEEETHNIVNYEECFIQNEIANKIMTTVKDLMLKYNIIPFNEDSRQGLLRYVFVRIGKFSKQVMVVLVVANDIFPGRKDFVRDLRKVHPEITTIIQNTNDTTTNMVLGTKERVLFGEGYIEDYLCGYTFRLSPTSFYQVNPVQTEILYKKAIEFASLNKNDVVLDAYSGTGTIGLVASQYCKEVISVELNKAAVKDAILNAKMNKVKNIYFYNEDATRFMVSLAREKETIDVLLMDPPRSGATMEFIDAIEILQPKTIVYVSCNVETQVRDIKQMQKIGYSVRKVQPVDLFPQTVHCENIVLMSKVKTPMA